MTINILIIKHQTDNFFGTRCILADGPTGRQTHICLAPKQYLARARKWSEAGNVLATISAAGHRAGCCDWLLWLAGSASAAQQVRAAFYANGNGVTVGGATDYTALPRLSRVGLFD